jgi:cation transporter-like permease
MRNISIPAILFIASTLGATFGAIASTTTHSEAKSAAIEAQTSCAALRSNEADYKLCRYKARTGK